MKTRNKNLRVVLFGCLVTTLVYAAKPASKAYLDFKMAALQAQINAIQARVNAG